jgi:hypothetical protein
MKKIYYWLIGVVIVFILTNPTFKDFENHLPAKDRQLNENRMKLHNYFIASTYINNTKIIDVGSTESSSMIYLGVMVNFFVIDKSNTIADRFMPIEDHSSGLKQDTITKKKK